ncbi:MAG: GNAT family N-acetyltransferase [Candidatus Krumholzibacteria bacterium]|nr:GNAT family N-acetyltransferase [Candidatus Krumholzibacteria bacterium]MDH4337947.1 GNAT family N-acetyltransferase [Candidatus Krumholzibacteria bacterium]MDH5270307.1 GNAT family N-acetyltransferase [Candidatus Krumholzibacteria bacterium]MDH5627677.1 GNAT family N-acetyltransferase [Candidatus Krumholzibacteria bacterium]
MFTVRGLQPADFAAVQRLSLKIYPDAPPWDDTQLFSHLRVFAEGQFVAQRDADGRIVGYAASLIVFWDDYEPTDTWRDFTDHGMFTNHDPENGRTLYAADVMVDPDCQGQGVGKLIYQAREKLLRDRRLLRIRAGARLQGYHRYHQEMAVEEYVRRVVDGELSDATLSFQLKRGFKVLGVVHGYMRHDPLSMGYAAVIEYLNDEVATLEDHRHQQANRFYRP